MCSDDDEVIKKLLEDERDNFVSITLEMGKKIEAELSKMKEAANDFFSKEKEKSGS